MKKQKSKEIRVQLHSFFATTVLTVTIDGFEIHDYISDRKPSIDFFPKKPALSERIVGLIESCL